MTADSIKAAHGFTTRAGGVSRGAFSSMNIAMHRGDAEENVIRNYELLAERLGFELKNTVLTRQTHSDTVRSVTRADARGLDPRAYPECDALITRDAGTVLTVFTADCTPILLWDRVTGAVGAVHAGWRGTAADIAGKTVRRMESELGCRPKDICAAIGPNIGACCFETDIDVPTAILAEFGKDAERYIVEVKGKYHVDLKMINLLALERAGVCSVEINGACTACERERFWSHRACGAERGSQGALIVCG